LTEKDFLKRKTQGMETAKLFDDRELFQHDGMRVIVTGQVGLDKQPFLEQVIAMASSNGIDATLFNVGEMMYREAPDVTPGRILDLPILRLNSLRRAVFRDILTQAQNAKNIIVNTHATFRWRHGLFSAFDHDLIRQLRPNMFITLIDDVDAVHVRLLRTHDLDHTIKDLLIWREEEILATDVLATVTRGYGCFYVLPRHESTRTVQSMYRLIFEPRFKKVYASFPMSHVRSMSSVREEIDRFRQIIAEHFTCFDPGDLEDKELHNIAVKAAEHGKRSVTVNVLGEEVQFDVDQILRCAGDIHGQIYARDFKFIEQSDMIISYIPCDENDRPILSSGVERELQHAHESAREAYVIWTAKMEPSPFITETATRVFRCLDEAMEFFVEKKYIKAYQREL
jgi:adenylate kinase